MGLDIGALEIILVLVIILIFWGPGKLPEIARTLGKTVRALRKTSYDFTSALTREVEKDTSASPGAAEPENEHQKLPPGAAARRKAEQTQPERQPPPK